jgi:hypothetical protein
MTPASPASIRPSRCLRWRKHAIQGPPKVEAPGQPYGKPDANNVDQVGAHSQSSFAILANPGTEVAANMATRSPWNARGPRGVCSAQTCLTARLQASDRRSSGPSLFLPRVRLAPRPDQDSARLARPVAAHTRADRAHVRRPSQRSPPVGSKQRYSGKISPASALSTLGTACASTRDR